jgi:AcrR family transcriptional regulator
VARSRERKADIIAAAQRAMAEYGAGVQLNQIASQAGLTSSAVLYHYPNIEDLLVDANRAGMERFYTERMERISSITDPVERLILTIGLGVPRDARDEEVRLLCALGGEAARNTVYAVLLTALYDRQVTMYQGILDLGVQTGDFRLAQDSLTIARNLVALEDAYGYRIVARHPTLDYDAAVSHILDYARLATDNPLTQRRARAKVTRLTRLEAP